MFTLFICSQADLMLCVHPHLLFPGSSSVCELELCWELALSVPNDIKCFLEIFHWNKTYSHLLNCVRTVTSQYPRAEAF